MEVAIVEFWPKKRSTLCQTKYHYLTITQKHVIDYVNTQQMFTLQQGQIALFTQLGPNRYSCREMADFSGKWRLKDSHLFEEFMADCSEYYFFVIYNDLYYSLFRTTITQYSIGGRSGKK